MKFESSTLIKLVMVIGNLMEANLAFLSSWRVLIDEVVLCEPTRSVICREYVRFAERNSKSTSDEIL